MKFKKLILATSGILAVGALTGCSGSSSDLVDEDYKLKDPGTLAAGFTDLSNQNANSPIDKDGYYTAGGKKFKVVDTFHYLYQTEPDDDYLNYLCNTWTYNSEHYTNMIDGLVENDKYGNIVGALALGYKVSTNSNGDQVWTFQLRENAEWVNNKTGKFVAKVTAEDFVTSAKYVLNPANGAGAANLYTDFIKGAEEYMEAEAPDFNTVGIKATGEFEIEYTLKDPAPYFISLLTYSPYLPTYAPFLEEQGTDFGKTGDNLLVNGAFRITEHIPENLIKYGKNFHYYDRDHVYVKHVEKKYLADDAELKTAREWFEAGILDSFNVQSEDEEGYKKYVTGYNNVGSIKNPASSICNGIQSYYGATYMGYWNFNRLNYKYDGQGSTVVQKTDKQKQDSMEALYNKNFRLGFLYGLDAETGNYLRDPEEPFNWVVRNYVNKELVSVAHDGKTLDFTDIMNNVYNQKKGLSGEDAVSLIGIDNGSDPIFSVDQAKACFAAAKPALDAAGVNYPIIIDVLGSRQAKTQLYREAMLAPVEEASKVDGTNPMVKINWLIAPSDEINTSWMSIDRNFDFSCSTGWGPDYADPKTYAHTLIKYGDLVKYFNLPTSEAKKDAWTAEQLNQYLPARFTTGKTPVQSIEAMMSEVFDEYDALYEAADAIIDPAQTYERYLAFAEAEYNSIYESALIVPWYTANGWRSNVSRTIPWQAGKASYGLTEDKLKNVIVTADAMTKDDRAAVTQEYDAGK